jgi:hypothetical protein
LQGAVAAGEASERRAKAEAAAAKAARDECTALRTSCDELRRELEAAQDKLASRTSTLQEEQRAVVRNSLTDLPAVT